MKNLIALFTCFLLVLLSAKIQAQSENDTIANSNAEMKHSLGATGGKANGIGLTYRYWPGKFGVQATLGPYIEEDYAEISAGITFLYSIAQTKYVELFAYQGNHFQYFEENYTSYPPQSPNGKSFSNVERSFHTGVGLGVEFIILKQINFDLMLGYTAVDNFEGLNITGGAGLYYNF